MSNLLGQLAAVALYFSISTLNSLVCSEAATIIRFFFVFSGVVSSQNCVVCSKLHLFHMFLLLCLCKHAFIISITFCDGTAAATASLGAMMKQLRAASEEVENLGNDDF